MAYPASVQTFSTIVDGVDFPEASDINPLYAEVTAIEQGLLNGFQHDLVPQGTRNLGIAGNRWNQGWFNGTVTTAGQFTGSGAGLTSIPITGIVGGSNLAQKNIAQTITGAWNFTQNLTTDQSVIAAGNVSAAGSVTSMGSFFIGSSAAATLGPSGTNANGTIFLRPDGNLDTTGQVTITTSGVIASTDLTVASSLVASGQVVLNSNVSATVSGTLNNFTTAGIGNANILILTTTAATTITGISTTPFDPLNGTELNVLVLGTNGVSFLQEDTGSLAANRLTVGAVSNFVAEGRMVRFVYVNSRWRLHP